MPEILSAATAMDAVTLHVEDLAGLAAYYRQALGLTTLSEGDGVTVLGRGATPVLVLRHTPGLPRPARDQAGLFHTAVLFATQADLAAAVLTAARHPRSHFVGSADHLVSEAFYFTDPEGNGIELYADRDRSLWPRHNGEIPMPSLALDPNDYLREHLTEHAVDAMTGARAGVGHVHLQVGDLDGARAFYVDALGFETTFNYTGALFVSAGGYHHHLAMNIWNSRGAGPRASSLGLGEVAITVPDREELDAVVARLRHHGVDHADDGRTVRTLDPWRNAVALSVADAA
ncbi:VOC family protein [Cellulomonas aerilata]|uniref:Glyoxalase n=1 Tax=Cellulomonas aerilata TaxID=515326 RepID=A0A512D9S0_9CELL|nr:VOC family protein [Cellulomonas aerilata]GEO33127.1 glyoxalase [Cellulomonas aerilata]